MGNKLTRTNSSAAKYDKAQYLLTASVAGVLLLFVGMPFYVILFLGAFSYFLFKIFSSEIRGEARHIFDFYLRAAEILRMDSRRWYGFEMQETISLGERLMQQQPAPQLVQFALGALYQKIGDNASAAAHLEAVVGPNAINESQIVSPSQNLREYVQLLRKIEREPAEAPQISAALRSLERLRKIRGSEMLAACRSSLSDNSSGQVLTEAGDHSRATSFLSDSDNCVTDADQIGPSHSMPSFFSSETTPTGHAGRDAGNSTQSHPSGYHSDRKSISEVLQDIYDDKVQ